MHGHHCAVVLLRHPDCCCCIAHHRSSSIAVLKALLLLLLATAAADVWAGGSPAALGHRGRVQQGQGGTILPQQCRATVAAGGFPAVPMITTSARSAAEQGVRWFGKFLQHAAKGTEG